MPMGSPCEEEMKGEEACGGPVGNLSVTSFSLAKFDFQSQSYDLNSTQEERDYIRNQKREDYKRLRRQCRRLIKCIEKSIKPKKLSRTDSEGNSELIIDRLDSPGLEDIISTGDSISVRKECPECNMSDDKIHDRSPHTPNTWVEEDEGQSGITQEVAITELTESSDSDSEEMESLPKFSAIEGSGEGELPNNSSKDSTPTKPEIKSKTNSDEGFEKWQRIIRLDAIRANAEWVPYSPTQAGVSAEIAQHLAESVGLKDYDNLEPCRIFHAARLVSILEAYALYDPVTGYCQGMSDILSPMIAVIEEDYEAFWCFAGFMRKARHNFRLDEEGITAQLTTISKIIKFKDPHLYKHLEKLQADNCFFVYRMVVVLFRRELTFEQTLCLWEVMWADQAAIRSGMSKSAWGKIRQRAPPTEDLLLYAIAACVLQRRKKIIEKYSSMDEILRECNSMAGQLDVWKLLDDAHDLVVTLHEKI
ncbi:hypothetical protein GIB67_001635 [Kingdonia uniflora]|uniref:Rab-GAP TBC domain-containing protein n=1 Tax=Kingdonia uniflora TaxID=39325 RepID=A0A7J7L0S9_9MAGN|nr:hypothetical protein GIB67_001635 [Kingdonia uniflora]